MSTARIPVDILDACERAGWENVYSLWLSRTNIRTTAPSTTGEIRCSVPFPFASDDKRASFSINIRNGLWRDFKPSSISIHQMQGGNIIQFIALMNAYQIDGKWSWDLPAAERLLRIELNLASAPDSNWLSACMAIIGNQSATDIWKNRKPWDVETLLKFGVGFDVRTNRLIFQIKEASGKAIATRQYNPAFENKMIWGSAGISGNILFPHSGWRENNLILVEGEPDVISLRRFGFNAVSGTMGAGNPVPQGGWHVNRNVVLLMDDDAAGHDAERRAVSQLKGCRELRIATLPYWDDRPSNADISDYIMHLQRQNFTEAEIKELINEVISNANLVDEDSNILVEPIDALLVDAMNAQNIDMPLRVKCNVLSRLAATYAVPHNVRLTCPGGGHTYCSRCFMQQRNGQESATFDLNKPNVTLRLVKVNEKMLRENMMRHLSIPSSCPDFTVEPVTYKSVDVIQATEIVEDVEIPEKGQSKDVSRYDMYILRDGDERILQGADYEMVTKPVPLPVTQGIVLFTSSLKRINGSFVTFEDTDEVLGALANTFRVERTYDDVLNHVRNIVDDYANAVTNIYGRPDLHLAYLLVWHSQHEFIMRGVTYERGRMELMVVGDTACGKTQAFIRMMKWLASGAYVDNKQATAAGLMGSVEISPLTGERFVVPGVLPRNDGLGPVLIDEFVKERFDRRTVLSLLSSVRSEGRVIISKAAHAEFQSRVRLIINANPGNGKMMKNMANSGAEMFLKAVEQPEDRRRFDLAMAVTQEDVDKDIVMRLHEHREPIFPKEMSRLLMNWGRSRGPGRIKFTESAYAAITSSALMMTDKYDSELGLVERSSQILRVAKVAVAVATLCFSHSNDGMELIVDDCHVHVGVTVMCACYDNPNFGYNEFSKVVMGTRGILNEDAVREAIFNTMPAAAHEGWINRIRHASIVRRLSFPVITPGNPMKVQSLLQTLVTNNCLQPSLYTDEYFVTPEFGELLLKMTKEIHEGNQIWSEQLSKQLQLLVPKDYRANTVTTKHHR